MTAADAQIFVKLAHDTERHFADMNREDRAAMISSLIRASHVCYGIWPEGHGYRLRLIRSVEPDGEDEVLAGVPVRDEQHAAMLAAAASHSRMVLQ